MIRLTVNGKEQELIMFAHSDGISFVDPQTPLLWVLREQLRLTGTKFGCGMAQCGACTVHVNGTAQQRAGVGCRSADLREQLRLCR